MMFITAGDKVVLTDADQPELQQFIGVTGHVQAVHYTYHPATARVLFPPNFRCDVYVRYLEVIPPDDSPFSYREKVKIAKDHINKGKQFKDNKLMVGKIAEIRGYDKRTDTYLLKCPEDNKGWFPANCLIPITYKGEKFYYPFEQILYKGELRVISQIKRTPNNYGQLLFIEGVWVPSSDVTPINI